MKLTRRKFAGLAAASAASLAMPSIARAQGGAVSFMSFTFAEDPNRPFVQKVFDDFRTASGVAVEPIGTAWGDTQRNILLRQRSRTLPATAQLQDRWLPAIAQMQEIVDLDAVLGKAEIEAALDPSVLAMGRVNGKMVGLPLISGSIGFVANREVMEKAGIAQVPTTIAELRAALIAVRDRVPNSVPFAMATKNPGSVPLDVLLFFWAHGARLIEDDGKVVVNSAGGRAAMEFMAGLMRDRLVAPEIDRPDARRLFAQGNCGFYIDAPAAKSFARNFSGRGEAADAFVLPMKSPVARAGDTPRSIEWGHIVSMFATSPVARDGAAARWMRHLVSDGVQTTLPLQLGGLPSTKSGRAAPGVQNDQFLKNWAAAVGTTMKHEVGIWSNSPELSTILTEETQAALLGQKTAAAATEAMHTRMEASMARRG
jgi:multiple sugar transport system substrate-binding protein